MNAAKPKPKTPQPVANDSTPPPASTGETGVREAPHVTRDSDRAAPPSEDFERHDTIPAPTWFDEGTE